MKRKNTLLLLLCGVLVVASLIIGRAHGEFLGADAQIEEAITQIDKEYTPWFNSIWEPPSGEIESLLFSLQAAIGAGFMGYYIGRKQNAKTNHRIIKEE